jgi:hypothetical protein
VATASGLFGGLLGGTVVGAPTDDRIELEWPSGARVRLEVTPDGTTGIHRLELESITPRAALEICGTPLTFP